MSERATFYYDFSSPYSYLAAERISGLFAEAGVEQPEWQPISFGHVLKETRPASRGRCEPRDQSRPTSTRSSGAPPSAACRRSATPDGWPSETYSLVPVRAAIFAKEAGKVVSFSPGRASASASRPAATSRDVDNVLIAAAACELHPKAVHEGDRDEVGQGAPAAGDGEAIERGVDRIPTVAVGDELFWGDDRLEDAVAAAA